MKSMNDILSRAVNNQIVAERLKYTAVGQNSLTIAVQDGPVKENGENGIDPVDVIRLAIGLFSELNAEFPCRQNDLTLTKLEEAVHWQLSRTADRELRGVEGRSAA